MKSILIVIISLYSHLVIASPEKTAIDFLKTGAYSLISDEDKKVYSQEEYKLKKYGLDNSSLASSHKNYQLEKFLLKQVSYKVISIKDKSWPIEVIVNRRFPKLLDEISPFNFSFQAKQQIDTLAQARLDLSHGKLNKNKLVYIEEEHNIKINQSGVYLNLASRKMKEEKRKKIAMHEKAIKVIVRSAHSNELAQLVKSTDLNDFKKLMAQINSIRANLKHINLEKNQLIKVKPDYNLRYFDQYKNNAEQAIYIHEVFNKIKKHLSFKHAQVQKSKEGPLAIFAQYSYFGKYQAQYLSLEATLYDANGKKLGVQIMHPGIQNLLFTKEKVFGYPLDKKYTSLKIGKVTLKPIGVFNVK